MNAEIPQEFSTEDLAKKLLCLCPKEPVRFYRALLWLLQHPKSARYLSGGAGVDQDTVPRLLFQCQLENQPEYLALAMYRNMLDRSHEIENEDTEDNDMRNRENGSIQNAD